MEASYPIRLLSVAEDLMPKRLITRYEPRRWMGIWPVGHARTVMCRGMAATAGPCFAANGCYLLLFAADRL